MLALPAGIGSRRQIGRQRRKGKHRNRGNLIDSGASISSRPRRRPFSRHVGHARRTAVALPGRRWGISRRHRHRRRRARRPVGHDSHQRLGCLVRRDHALIDRHRDCWRGVLASTGSRWRTGPNGRHWIGYVIYCGCRRIAGASPTQPRRRPARILICDLGGHRVDRGLTGGDWEAQGLTGCDLQCRIVARRCSGRRTVRNRCGTWWSVDIQSIEQSTYGRL